MRDEVTQNMSASDQTGRLDIPFGPTTRTWVNFHKREYRSDVIRTAPAFNGQYYRPTTYASCFITVVTGNCDYLYTPAGLNQRWWRRGNSRLSNVGNIHQLGLIGTTAGYAPATTLNMFNEASSKVLSKLYDGVFETGVFLAELAKSVTGIVGNLTKLAIASSGAKQGKWKEVFRALGLVRSGNVVRRTKRTTYEDGRVVLTPTTVVTTRWRPTKVVASAWLTLLYGWLPLVHDIMDSLTALAKLAEEQPVTTVKGNVKRKIDVPLAGRDPEAEGTCEVGVEYAISYRVRSDDIATLRQLGLLNPLPALWELVPFSFVLDWLLSVGTMMQNLSATAGLQFMHGYRSEWTKGGFTHRWVASTENFLSGTKQHATVKSFVFKRTILHSFPSPALYVKVGGPSAVQTASAMALLIRARKG